MRASSLPISDGFPVIAEWPLQFSSLTVLLSTFRQPHLSRSIGFAESSIPFMAATRGLLFLGR